MEIYTSYYGKAERIDTSEYLLVQVSNTCPKWFTKKVLPLPDIYPDWKLVDGYKKGLIDPVAYKRAYVSALTPAKITVARELLKQAVRDTGKQKILFLCYEGKTNFCHRHTAAEVVAGHPCEELD